MLVLTLLFAEVIFAFLVIWNQKFLHNAEESCTDFIFVNDKWGVYTSYLFSVLQI